MSPTTNQRDERRRGSRADSKGTVILRANGAPLHGRIVNLGAGGACFRTLEPLPSALLGASAELDVRLDGRSSAWITVGGILTRIGPDHRAAIRLVDIPPAYDELVRAELDASRREGGIDRVVFVDRNDDRRAVMAAAFRRAGCEVVEVSTPLEAIVRIDEARYEPELIAIADSHPDWISDELRVFLQVEHPQARMLTIGDEVLGPAGERDWLSSRDPDHDLVERIERLVCRRR